MKKYVYFAVLCLTMALGALAEELTFDDCVKEAAVSNKELKSASEKLSQAEFNKALAEASLWPSAAASASWNDNLTNSSSTNSYNLGISYNIFDGFNTRYGIAQAEEQLRYARTVYDTASASVRMKLKDAYVEVMRSQNLVRLSAQIAARRKQSAELIKLRYEAGNEHKGSWLLAEANYTQSKYDETSAGRALDLAGKQLSALLGREKGSPLSVHEDFALTLDTSLKQDYDALAAKTPGVLGAGYLAKYFQYALEQSNTPDYPTLSANAGYGGSISGGTGSQFSLGLSAAYTIFDGFKAKNNIDKAASALRQAKTDFDNAVLTAVFSLEQSWSFLLNAADQIDSQKKFYEANFERTRIADAQYEQGLLTFDSWTLIEDQLISSEKNLLNSRASALTNEAAWVNTLGGTLEDYMKEKNLKRGQ